MGIESSARDSSLVLRQLFMSESDYNREVVKLLILCWALWDHVNKLSEWRLLQIQVLSKLEFEHSTIKYIEENKRNNICR